MDSTIWVVLIGGLVTIYTGTLNYLKSRDQTRLKKAEARIVELTNEIEALRIAEQKCVNDRETDARTVSRLEHEVRNMETQNRELLQKVNTFLEGQSR